MLFGDEHTFAIECQLVATIGDFVYANFRIWASGQPIGDYEDHALLDGCVGWLIDFMSYADSRCEPSLDDKTKEEVWKLLFDSVMLTIPKGKTLADLPPDESEWPPPEIAVYGDMQSRFHLDQVGMSSFWDKWNVILVERSDGAQRLIWRNLDDMVLSEALLPPGYFNEVASQFIEWGSTKVAKGRLRGPRP